MRILFAAIAVFLVIPASQAQESTKTWIFFTDKLDKAGKTMTVEPGYVSERAMVRRQMRGTPGMEAIFDWQDAPVSPDYVKQLETMNIAIEQRSRWLNAVTAWVNEDQLRRITALEFVRKTRPVAHLAPQVAQLSAPSLVIARRHSASCPVGHSYGQSCNQLDLVNAIPPMERGINGNGVILGFLDTLFGIDEPFDHSSLNHIRVDNRLKEWRDFANRDPNQLCVNESSRHGMSVASVAVGYEPGYLFGPAYGATVYAATTECGPYERNIEEDNFIAATEWMVSEGADVLNSSLGYTTFDVGEHSYTTDELDGDTGLTTRIFDWAASRGVVPVTSAGNSGNSFSWPYVGMPADGDSVIAVGASDELGSRVSFSSRGPTADGRTKPDVMAQGGGVFLARIGGHGLSSGTSFSSPMVAGVVAQILQVNPNLGPIGVWDVLTSTASQATTPDNYYGWGTIDADRAVKLAETRVSRAAESVPQPEAIAIETPYPNPFRETTRFKVSAARAINSARLTIYNVIGQEVAAPLRGFLPAGSHEIDFEAARLPSGLYAYVLETDHVRLTGTMVIAR